jgi:hypothetical protein
MTILKNKIILSSKFAITVFEIEGNEITKNYTFPDIFESNLFLYKITNKIVISLSENDQRVGFLNISKRKIIYTKQFNNKDNIFFVNLPKKNYVLGRMEVT